MQGSLAATKRAMHNNEPVIDEAVHNANATCSAPRSCSRMDRWVSQRRACTSVTAKFGTD